MAIAKVEGVRLAGVASAVPEIARPITDSADVFGADDVRKISQSTGVERRHVSAGKLCASDLCYAAARKLLNELKWDLASVDALIFVSQTPDFPCIPATSCILQMRLGLPSNCAAFDVALGCSGYVYGLWTAASLIAGSGLSRVLLLAGDVIHRVCSPQDRSTALLFGDAGSATALEKDPSALPMSFSLGTDGVGWKNLVIQAGGEGGRQPRSNFTRTRLAVETNNLRSAEDMFMDGAEIFAFTLREVPPLVSNVLAAAGWNREDVDYFVFHQANKFMLTHLAKFMKLPLARVPISLHEYGNTSSASIPVTLNSQLADKLAGGPLRLVLGGFGVGFSWAGCSLVCGPIVALPIIAVEESEAWVC